MNFRNLSKVLAISSALFFGVLGASASETEPKEEKFNAGEMILHHVMDAHEIHFVTLNEGTPDVKHISIPLPIIVWSKEKGLDFFLSSKFHSAHHEDGSADEDNGHAVPPQTAGHTGEPVAAHEEVHPANQHPEVPVYNGYALIHEKIYLTDAEGNINFDAEGHPTNVMPLDLSITKTVAGLFLTIFILLFSMISVARAYKKRGLAAPKGLQSFVEPIILFVRDDIAKPSIGPKAEKFMPYLLSVFFFILIANLIGLIPFIGGFNVTGNIAITLVLALLTFLYTAFSGNKDYWLHIFNTPGVPWWLKFPVPLMPIIELMGFLSKPVVLCLRLFANVTAGHIIILSFISLIFIFNNLYGTGAAYGASILSVAFGIFMNVMELLVAFLQAYVFTLLSAIYLGQAVEEHQHGDHHHDHAHTTEEEPHVI